MPVVVVFLAVLLAGCASPQLALPARASAEKHGRTGDTVTLDRSTATLHQVQAPATIAGVNLGLNVALATTTPTSNAVRPRAGYSWGTFDITLTDIDSTASLVVNATVKLTDGTTRTPAGR